MLTQTNPLNANTSTELFTHLITLINRLSGDEQSFRVETQTDRFSEVLREIAHQKAVRGLRGYELFEAIPLNSPVPF